MIDTRVIKDVSGQTDLCETYTYCDKLEYLYLGLNKTISDIVRVENRYIIYFSDDTSFAFIIQDNKELYLATIDENGTLVIYLYYINKTLLQVETGLYCGTKAIDIIEGYNDGKPYSRFSYREIDKPETV